ncbi:hypothetical protein SAMN05216311_11175 [Chitinophaga sp. CF418]|nr:hypothetical protein SAMN05216311_11175 [Chitinophaga sp. CF418]
MHHLCQVPQYQSDGALLRKGKFTKTFSKSRLLAKIKVSAYHPKY